MYNSDDKILGLIIKKHEVWMQFSRSRKNEQKYVPSFNRVSFDLVPSSLKLPWNR